MMGDKDKAPYEGSVWIRWTDGGDDYRLDRICRLRPALTLGRSIDDISFIPENGEHPWFEDPATGEQRELVFVGGLPRQVIRHTPLAILVASFVVVAGTLFDPALGGLGVLVPAPGPWLTVPLFVGVSAVALMVVLRWGDLLEPSQLPRSALVYLIHIGLSIGVVITIILVFFAGDPRAVEGSVLFVAGYLLTYAVGGMLFYDAILRIEHLFVNLHKTQIVVDETKHRRYLTGLANDLERTRWGIPVSHLFALVLVVQFAIVWAIGTGPQGLGSTVGIVVNLALNFVALVAIYQFFVLTKHVSKLLACDETRVLGYEPFHVDGYAGYRDLGRFAVRMNTLLALAGLYLIYRLVFNGSRVYPGFEAGTSFELAVWLVNYVGPVVLYAIGVTAWLVLSFWGMHRKMLQEKFELCLRYQGVPDTDGPAGVGVPITRYAFGPDWLSVKNSPEWPIDRQQMNRVVSGDFIPLLLSIPGGYLLF